MNRTIVILLLLANSSLLAQSNTDSTKKASPSQTNSDSNTGNPPSDAGTKKPAKLDTLFTYNYVCNSQLSTCVLTKANGNYLAYLVHKPVMANGSSNATIDSSAFAIDKLVNNIAIIDWLTAAEQKGCSDEHKSIATLIRDKIQTDQQNVAIALNRKLVDSLTSLLQDINRTAGAFRFRNINVPVYLHDKTRKPNAFLKIGFIHIKTDYNRISDITLTNVIYNDGAGKKQVLAPISNRNYSLGLASLNNNEFYRQITSTDKSIDAANVYFNYADFLGYEPYGKDYSYIIKNDDYYLDGKDTLVKVMRRSYSDYLSFRTFLDPLGFLGNTANGYAQLEGDFILPMRTTNHRIFDWISQFHVNANYIYSNSINNDPRIAKPIAFKSRYVAANATKDSTAYYFHNIDIAKYAYYQLYGRFSIVALDLHRLNSWLHIEGGARMIGARVYTSDTTKTSTALVHLFIPEINLNLQIRPDYIIGSEINIGFEYLGNSLGNNSPGNITNPELLYRTNFAINHEINLYSKVSPDGTGGLFLRYVGWLAFNKYLSNSIVPDNQLGNSNLKKTSYFPQILLGYSTNLNALIKSKSKPGN